MTAKNNQPCKSVIITGGNTGLGYKCAYNIVLSDQEWQIIIASRDTKKANDAVIKLKAETGNNNIIWLELDLASLTSVRNFENAFLKSGLPPLHAIICNAGLQIIKGTTYTRDGFEMTFGVNHLGHFLLVNLLLKHISEPGRIIFVSSGTHDSEQVTGLPAPIYVNAETLAYPDSDSSEESDAYIGRRRYSTSKLCNIYCTYEFADRIKRETNKNITVNAFDPGLMPGTGLARQVSPIAFFVWKYFMPIITLLPINANTPKKSGKALASLVTSPLFSNVTGKYFEGIKEKKSSKLSYSKENAQDLWNTSVNLVKLLKDETILSI
jgi:NAD(P)-dependent dehydrogenase (short-subunit alcohol dehydrogenase family)